MKLLMVCLGNICRSPLAEGIMQNKINAKKLDWKVDSAGTGAWHVGELPDPRSIDVAKKYGIDITRQRGRQFKAADFDAFDYIFAMDASNYNNIIKLAKNDAQKQKVSMIMNWADPGMNQGVPDPYHDNDGFENVYDMIDRACDSVVEKLVL